MWLLSTHLETFPTSAFKLNGRPFTPFSPPSQSTLFLLWLILKPAETPSSESIGDDMSLLYDTTPLLALVRTICQGGEWEKAVVTPTWVKDKSQ